MWERRGVRPAPPGLAVPAGETWGAPAQRPPPPGLAEPADLSNKQPCGQGGSCSEAVLARAGREQKQRPSPAPGVGAGPQSLVWGQWGGGEDRPGLRRWAEDARACRPGAQVSAGVAATRTPFTTKRSLPGTSGNDRVLRSIHPVMDLRVS